MSYIWNPFVLKLVLVRNEQKKTTQNQQASTRCKASFSCCCFSFHPYMQKYEKRHSWEIVHICKTNMCLIVSIFSPLFQLQNLYGMQEEATVKKMKKSILRLSNILPFYFVLFIPCLYFEPSSGTKTRSSLQGIS